MATLFCGCGYKLWSEFWWSGSKHEWVFLDDEPVSDTYADRVNRCPGCGSQVAHDGRGGIEWGHRSSQQR